MKEDILVIGKMIKFVVSQDLNIVVKFQFLNIVKEKDVVNSLFIKIEMYLQNKYLIVILKEKKDVFLILLKNVMLFLLVKIVKQINVVK